MTIRHEEKIIVAVSIWQIDNQSQIKKIKLLQSPSRSLMEGDVCKSVV